MEFEKWATETINSLVEEVKEIKENLGKNNNKKIKDKLKWKFTEDEKVILRNLQKRYKYIARDNSGDLCVYENKPFKIDGIWKYTGFYNYELLSEFNHLFKSIKWKDEEPCKFRKFI